MLGLRRGALALAVGCMVIASRAGAQAIERNAPPAPAPGPARIDAPAPPAISTDSRPIAGPLRALVILGADAGVQNGVAQSGVTVPTGGRLDTPATRRRLASYLGRPLSLALISRLEADVARTYRRTGYPLVSVSAPAQEVTGGVLRLRVIEFHLETVTAPGARDPRSVLDDVRARPGGPVDTRELAQDLDWLNRYPFRSVTAGFSPGAALGATGLVLQTRYTRPVNVYAGYANSGSPLTGFDRYYSGVVLPVPFLGDATVSYQFTGSNDVLFAGDRPFNGAADPRYLSHALRLYAPVGARQAVEFTYSYVASNEATDFTAHQVTQEYAVDYRAALSNLHRSLPGESVLGVETRHEDGRTLFAGEPVQDGRLDVFQVFLGWSDHEADRWGRTSADLTLHLSPGGVNSLNTDAQFAAASQGRSRSAEYGYLSGDLSRYTRLPGGFGYALQLVAQYAPRPLPLTEQFGVGGSSLVRGYTLDDGVFDTGLLARNELRAPPVAAIGRWVRGAAVDDQLQPYAFVDAAYGRNNYTRGEAAPVGLGLGADYQLATRLSAGVSAAWALRPEGFTHSGRFRLESRATVSF